MRDRGLWELCWYRYEVDLSDEVPSVRVEDQGYELDELHPREREPNAAADEHGGLGPADVDLGSPRTARAP